MSAFDENIVEKTALVTEMLDVPLLVTSNTKCKTRLYQKFMQMMEEAQQ